MLLSLIKFVLRSPCPRLSDILSVGLMINRPLFGAGARPEGSYIDPLHVNCREPCVACAAPIVAAMVSPTIAPLNIVFLRFDSPPSQAVKKEHDPGETSCPAGNANVRSGRIAPFRPPAGHFRPTPIAGLSQTSAVCLRSASGGRRIANRKPFPTEMTKRESKSRGC
jgi:hypothetical protein